jgi:hypothetical protein
VGRQIVPYSRSIDNARGLRLGPSNRAVSLVCSLSNRHDF